MSRNLTNRNRLARALRVRFLTAGLLGLVFAVSFEFASAASRQGTASTDGPEVSMGSTKRDFGDVYAGEELEQNFPVRNLGSKQLELAQKSNLTSPPGTGNKATAALWRPSEHLPVRFVGANRAAPS